MDEKEFEYLEAACLLHNIGLFTGKKGYHKQTYRIIMVSVFILCLVMCSMIECFYIIQDILNICKMLGYT